MQARYGVSPSDGGRSSSGKSSRSHAVSGMELMTTCGTLYVSCSVRRAWRSDAAFVIVTSVRTLFRGQRGLLHGIMKSTDSTSNQFGVMIVARGRAARYMGITSGETYSLPESPRTAVVCLSYTFVILGNIRTI